MTFSRKSDLFMYMAVGTVNASYSKQLKACSAALITLAKQLGITAVPAA